MKKALFLADRRPAWARFERLLRDAEGARFTRLGGKEVSELSELFRASCYDLATVRSREWGSELERYLNDLVVRGHAAFYGSRPRQTGEVARFFTERFPRLLRKNIGFFWLSAALFVVPFALSWLLVGRQPDLASRVLPSGTLAHIEEMYSQGEKGDRPKMESAMAGFYVSNNVSIAFRCFALGIFFGIGTIYILLFNGIYLGTVTGFVIAKGHGERFLSFVVSHGSFELTAIVVSGAAGLILGHALMAPGQQTRIDALRKRGRVAVELALGAAGMLAVAALIEAFWSPSPLPPTVKYIVGGLLWTLVALYLAAAGRAWHGERKTAGP